MSSNDEVGTPADLLENKSVQPGQRYRHSFGTTYAVLGTATVQTKEALTDYAEVVVYRAEDPSRLVWVRPISEFADGRFTLIEASSAPATDAEFAEHYRDKAEGLSADLDGAVEKLWEVGGAEGREWVGWNYAKTAERLRREDEASLASAPPPAVPDAVGVRVKELDWRSLMDETFIVETVLGIYRIEDDGALFTDDRFRLYLAPNVAKAQKHPSLASAKAAAQADYDRRITKALSRSPFDLPDLIERAMPPVAAIPAPGSFEEGWFRGVLKYRRNLDKAVAALSSIEPTPSPEPQASNAGAVEALRPAGWAYEFHEFGDVWKRHIILNWPEALGSANPPTKHHGGEIRNVRPVYFDLRAALSTEDYRASPEPQASNAGAVEALTPARQALRTYRLATQNTPCPICHGIEGCDHTVRERLLADLNVNSPALSTPAPQTGERDGEVVAWAKEAALARLAAMAPGADSFQLSNAKFSGFNVPLVRQSALLAERTAREAIVIELAELAGKFDACAEMRDYLAAEALRFIQKSEASERRLAEVEERAREDLAHVEAEARRYAEAYPQSSDGRNTFVIFADMVAARAALRAKPEAQAIAGKEAGE